VRAVRHAVRKSISAEIAEKFYWHTVQAVRTSPRTANKHNSLRSLCPLRSLRIACFAMGRNGPADEACNRPVNATHRHEGTACPNAMPNGQPSVHALDWSHSPSARRPPSSQRSWLRCGSAPSTNQEFCFVSLARLVCFVMQPGGPHGPREYPRFIAALRPPAPSRLRRAIPAVADASDRDAEPCFRAAGNPAFPRRLRDGSAEAGFEAARHHGRSRLGSPINRLRHKGNAIALAVLLLAPLTPTAQCCGCRSTAHPTRPAASRSGRWPLIAAATDDCDRRKEWLPMMHPGRWRRSGSTTW
jgi:hypothetical protein